MKYFETIHGSNPIIIHAPHTGLALPDQAAGRLADAAPLMLDRHARPLAAALSRTLDATLMTADASRVWCDPERYPDDREPWNAHGHGVIHTRDATGRPLYPDGEPDMTERGRRLDLMYRPWHATLAMLARLMLDTYGRALIIDTHTHPVAPRMGEPYATLPRPDVNLGHNGDPASVETAARLMPALLDAGFTVGVNQCRQGSIRPNAMADPRLATIRLSMRADTAARPDARLTVARVAGETLACGRA